MEDAFFRGGFFDMSIIRIGFRVLKEKMLLDCNMKIETNRMREFREKYQW